jgi:hypothetical protein
VFSSSLKVVGHLCTAVIPEKDYSTTITIGYDVPWKDMHQALIDATKTALVLQNLCLFVLQTSLDDFYVSYQINAYVKEPNKQAVIYSPSKYSRCLQ